MLVRLLEPASKLEGWSISQITPEVFFEVVDAVEEVSSMGVKVDWLDNVIEKIMKANYHQKLTYCHSHEREHGPSKATKYSGD